ncbi:MAG TPA: HEAT repeat domain-containing protein, partial [Candidatus Obscuribacterales bacterium]
MGNLNFQAVNVSGQVRLDPQKNTVANRSDTVLHTAQTGSNCVTDLEGAITAAEQSHDGVLIDTGQQIFKMEPAEARRFLASLKSEIAKNPGFNVADFRFTAPTATPAANPPATPARAPASTPGGVQDELSGPLTRLLTQTNTSYGPEQKSQIAGWLDSGQLSAQLLKDKVLNSSFATDPQKAAFVQALGEALASGSHPEIESALLEKLQTGRTSPAVRTALLGALSEVGRLPEKPYAAQLKTFLLGALPTAPQAELQASASLLRRLITPQNAAEIASALISRFDQLQPELQNRVLSELGSSQNFPDPAALEASLLAIKDKLGGRIPPALMQSFLSAMPTNLKDQAPFKAIVLQALSSDTPAIRDLAQGKLNKFQFSLADLNGLRQQRNASPECLSQIIEHLQPEVFADPASRQVLSALLDHPSPKVRSSVITAVNQCQTIAQDLRQTLLGKALKDPNLSTQRYAVSSFMQIRGPEAIQTMIGLLKGNQPPEILKDALSNLNFQLLQSDVQAPPELTRLLLGLSSQANPELRAKATEVLGTIAQNHPFTEPDKQTVIDSLRNRFAQERDPAARLKLVATMESLDLQDMRVASRTFLHEQLSNPNPDLRREAIERLQSLGDLTSVGPLLNLAEQEPLAVGIALRHLQLANPRVTAEAGAWLRAHPLATTAPAQQTVAARLKEAGFELPSSEPPAQLKSLQQALQSGNLAQIQAQWKQLAGPELRQALQLYAAEIQACPDVDLKAVAALYNTDPKQVTPANLNNLREQLGTYNRLQMQQKLPLDPALLRNLEVLFVAEAAKITDSSQQAALLSLLPGIDRSDVALFAQRGSLAELGQLIQNGTTLSQLPADRQATLKQNLNHFLELSGESFRVDNLSEAQLHQAISKLEVKLGLPQTGALSLDNLRAIEQTQRNLFVMTTNARNILNDELALVTPAQLDQMLADPAFKTRAVAYAAKFIPQTNPPDENLRLRAAANHLRLNDMVGINDNNGVNVEQTQKHLQVMRQLYHGLVKPELNGRGFSLEQYSDTMQARNQWLEQKRDATVNRDRFNSGDVDQILQLLNKNPRLELNPAGLRAIVADDRHYTLPQREAARKLLENENLFDYVWSFSRGDAVHNDTHAAGGDGAMDLRLHPEPANRAHSSLSRENLAGFRELLAKSPIQSPNGRDHGVVISDFHDGRVDAGKLYQAAKVKGDDGYLNRYILSYLCEGAGSDERSMIDTLKANAGTRGKVLALQRA